MKLKHIAITFFAFLTANTVNAADINSETLTSTSAKPIVVAQDRPAIIDNGGTLQVQQSGSVGGSTSTPSPAASPFSPSGQSTPPSTEAPSGQMPANLPPRPSSMMPSGAEAAPQDMTTPEGVAPAGLPPMQNSASTNNQSTDTTMQPVHPYPPESEQKP